MPPAVSVIIPVYQRGMAVHETVDSIRNQTLSDWELILVDDGSADDTPGMLEKIAGADSRIRLLRIENSGQNIARNRGLELAKADFVRFLDHDDVLLPWALEEQCALLNTHDVPLVSGPATGADEDEFDARFRKLSAQLDEGKFIEIFEDVYSLDAAYHPTCNEILFRAEPLRRAGGFPNRRGTCEEISLLLALQLTAANTRCLRHGPRPCLLKRLSPLSLARHYRDKEPSRWPMVTLCETTEIALREGKERDPRFVNRVIKELYPAAVIAWRNGWKAEALRGVQLFRKLTTPRPKLTPSWHDSLHRLLGFRLAETALDLARKLKGK